MQATAAAEAPAPRPLGESRCTHACPVARPDAGPGHGSPTSSPGSMPSGIRVQADRRAPERTAQIDELALRVGMIDVLTGQLSQLNARVSAQAEFGAQLSSMRDRITELQGDTDDARGRAGGDDDASSRPGERAHRSLVVTDALAAQMGLLAERVTATDANARQAGEQVAALEQRVSSVGTELANQISELGRDIDGLAERTAEVASGTVSDEVMAALRGGQIKLANEQARYEIAFREDLAALGRARAPQPEGLTTELSARAEHRQGRAGRAPAARVPGLG